MPLPKVVTPSFEVNLISTGKTVKYRPFLVKEEKVLLIATERGTEKDITNAVKDVLNACIQTRGVKAENLPSFDLEYLFLNIRGKSVGESVDILVTCKDDNETQVPLTVRLSDITLATPEEHTDTIDLGGGIFLKMKYPSLQQFVENNFVVSDAGSNENLIDKAFKAIASCIESVYQGEEAWSASDCTEKELVGFLEQLDSVRFSKVEEFFTTMPRLSYRTTVKNPKTEVESEVVIEGLSNFFA